MNKILAVDFDGTLCTDRYPEIGEPIDTVIAYVTRVQRDGWKVILNTCRIGDRLTAAVEWCKNQGLLFNAINENLPEVIEAFGGDTRKIYADIYLDDKAISSSAIHMNEIYRTIRR